jgi:2-dehydro-3-deoxygluconokinase
VKGNFDVVTLGEAMIRLSPPRPIRLEQATTLDLNVGGSELNVAFNASRLGLSTSWVSKLPKSPLGRRIIRLANEQGVDASHVIWSDEGRAGLYFVEFGITPRTTTVTYDRKRSAMSTLRPGEVDWSFLEGVKLFHVSGITPALSDSCRETTFEAVTEASRHGCKVSLDMNYRSKLWSPKKAEKTLTKLAGLVNLLIASDPSIVWSIGGETEKVLREVKERFNVETVAMLVRQEEVATRGACGAVALSDRIYTSSRFYNLEIFDRLGAGDSFAAGLIFGYLNGDMQMAVEWGAAMAAIKHTVPGDANYVTKEEVEELVKRGELYGIQR